MNRAKRERERQRKRVAREPAHQPNITHVSPASTQTVNNIKQVTTSSACSKPISLVIVNIAVHVFYLSNVSGFFSSTVRRIRRAIVLTIAFAFASAFSLRLKFFGDKLQLLCWFWIEISPPPSQGYKYSCWVTLVCILYE